MPEGWSFDRTLLDTEAMRATIRRMAEEIVERTGGAGDVLLIGIRTRGLPLAEAINDAIEETTGERLALGVLDITLYRDDLSTIAPQPVVKETRLPGSIDDRTLVLCDDVLFTGRTVRAALEALVDFGRPSRVYLAVLVDRGLRELPIQADVVGETIETTRDQQVEVRFPSTDDAEKVDLLVREG